MPKKIAKKAKKKAVKKSAKKPTKRSVKKTAKKKKKDLKHASSEQSFWVNDGTVIANLIELSDALDAMNQEVFGYHVTKEKNDFADWIEHVLDDIELATKVRKSKKPNTARKVIVSRLRVYSI
jgi:hypothetical protein